jgi:hypothetical protein
MKKLNTSIYLFLFATVSITAQQIEVVNTSGDPAVRTEGTGYSNSIEIDNNSQSYRLTSWTDNDFLIVKSSGTTFTPFRIQDNSFSDALRLGSIGVGVGESSPTARLHVTATSPDVLNLESNSQTTMNFYTGTTLQYQIRKLGSGTGDFQYINNSSNSNTVWVNNGTIKMLMRGNGQLGIGEGVGAVPDTRLHVRGDSDADLYEFEIEDDNFAFMQFDAALQSGMAFRNGSTTNANIWYRGNATTPGLIFNTDAAGGTIHMFIEDNTGNVGIGDETPDAIFDVEGDTDAVNFGSRTGSAWGYVNTQRPSTSTNATIQRWRDGTATQATMNLDSDSYQFSINGSALATGGTWDISDANLKRNIATLSSGIEKVLRLNPSSYEFKNDEELRFMKLPEGEQYGFLAQELKAVIPSAVKEGIITNADGEVAVDHDIHTVNYNAIIPVLTKAIQEQQAMIKALEARIAELEK